VPSLSQRVERQELKHREGAWNVKPVVRYCWSLFELAAVALLLFFFRALEELISFVMFVVNVDSVVVLVLVPR
jgi:hypothetical protein